MPFKVKLIESKTDDILLNKLVKLVNQPEEEVSSAGEQLASNRADGFTVIKVEEGYFALPLLLYLLPGSYMA